MDPPASTSSAEFDGETRVPAPGFDGPMPEFKGATIDSQPGRKLAEPGEAVAPDVSDARGCDTDAGSSARAKAMSENGADSVPKD
jgi:hypothetical protein